MDWTGMLLTTSVWTAAAAYATALRNPRLATAFATVAWATMTLAVGIR